MGGGNPNAESSFMDSISHPIRFTRRQALAGMGLAPGVLATGPALAQDSPGAIELLTGANVCLLSPQAVEGPFYFDPKLERSDIREDRNGVPLVLRLQIVEAANCAAASGSRVDIWHADASGHYSGYDQQGDGQDVSTKGQTFLRGTQLVPASGIVSFSTIYPGWYRGRTPHIHFKVFVDDNRNVITGQIYFPDALSEFIYLNVAPYSGRGTTRDTTNDRDGVLRQSGGGRDTFCAIKEEADHYLALLVVGIDRNATPSESGPGGPPPGGPPPGGPPPGMIPGEGPPGGGQRGSLVPGA